jgi:ficolin
MLRRVDASVDFKRNLADYVAGFGDPAGNYWHGLDRIHALTSAAPMGLMVTMETFEGDCAYAIYSNFIVGDAASGYQLAIGGYSGTAGDSMDWHNGMQFTTIDNDMDLFYENCATYYHGGWWYNDCHDANPTGLYLNGANTADSQGINWASYRGFTYSLKRIEFTITPQN